MKKLILLVLVFNLIGCTAAQKGAGIGAAVGGGLGAIIGHQSGNTAEGALIGAAAGGLGGALIGEQVGEKKFCPTCGKQFGSDATYCPDDGTELKPIKK